MKLTLPRALAAAATATLLAIAPSQVAGASTGLTESTGNPPVTASPEMTEAMQRDLDLTAAQVEERVAHDEAGSDLADRFEDILGDTFAGAWLDEDQLLVVAVTDTKEVNRIRALGATPRVVERSADDLAAVMTALDRTTRPSPNQVTGWYVDVETNEVVIEALPNARGTAQRFVRTAGADADAVRIETTTDKPQLYYDVRGGDAYYPGSSRCSIGFSVNGGFVTAGHCGGVGTTTRGYNQVTQGVVRGSRFPGNDYAWVEVNSNWTPTPLVNRYSGSQTVTVAGSAEAAVGASVCRSGSTTGWRCGTIQAKNQTVNYPQGSVSGLTRTTACAEGGDSGGSWLAGQQAQGVTSGGSGNCSVGGTTYFQPIWPILSAYGRTLVTSGGGTPPPTGCSSYPNVFTGSLSGTGSYQYQPNGSYFYSSRSGTHQGCLSGPSSADFDLYLQRWNGSSWATVASSTGSTSSETISYNGSTGYYRYVVYSYSGSGSYTLGIRVP
ncbi:MAG TPA: S1 family peptidase [Jiangellaceae bacterium]